jgi:hypothetical protein
MEQKQPRAGKAMPMMDMGKVPNPDPLITTFEKQVVLPDEALFCSVIPLLVFSILAFFDIRTRHAVHIPLTVDPKRVH